jgi:HEAT repeat protein
MSKRSFFVGVLSAALAFGALSAASSEAVAAEGVVIAPGRIPAAARAKLLAQIESARQTSPAAFAAVAEVRAQVPELDAQKRGRLAAVTPILKAIGPGALFPMLAELAVDAPARGDRTETAWAAWRIGLLEAVGSIRDARSEDVLIAILESPETDFAVVKAAAEALGKVGSDRAAAKLVLFAKATGPKQAAVLAGMGECRRTVTTEALVKAIAAKPDQATAKHIVRSLGNAGSAWAWQTPVIQASGEEAAVRSAAAKALVGAFVAYEGEARKAAEKSILVVNDPSTPALIEAAKKSASPALAADLDALAARFAKNPIR